MIPGSEIPECREFEVKSKIGKSFMNETFLEECSVRIYEIDPFFMSITKKNKVEKIGCEYILFRIDVYFTEYFQLQKLINKTTKAENLFLGKKTRTFRKKTQLQIY